MKLTALTVNYMVLLNFINVLLAGLVLTLQ